ncbi:MAG TPA: OmpH family outer membrane protein [Bacteroidales bacterium]|jgi:outer membrane protein|nr:OmpH family outer membrane protein [Bacteroidales bacterium]HOF46001.1 OmpH family outer membrane protein [Bacteroidales bacterium]HOS57611.1 OmpH family outer membrane protein [Bacteroidales bacterium]HPY80458.1 OmpH family outer membrane protein [Bacteroidales bacterium]HRR04579.1 OmpH family outer membrane protein [Bacteroidales bacterium]
MKNRILITIVTFLFLFPAVTSAQHNVKFAHLNSTEIYKIMPGVDTAQQYIIELQEELSKEGEALQNEFKEKYEQYTKMSSTYSATVMKMKEDELNAMYVRIQEFSQNAEEELLLRQQELLKPFQDRLLAIVKKIAEAENYTYVFDTSTLLHYDGGNDITDKVKKELGIK